MPEFYFQLAVIIGSALLVLIGLIIFISRFYRKVPQGKAIVRNGVGGLKVAFDRGIIVVPVLHRADVMDISVKRMEIQRLGKEGLICKDNLRADIKVVFFVRVNKDSSSVERVAQTIGCDRASDNTMLTNLFEAKFSEALKTAGKRFNFVELYEARIQFKKEIIDIIGQDLNGYVLDDIAIDYLEQTHISFLDSTNILDSEGIKKITELTAQQHILANQIQNDEQMRVTKQDTERQEAIYEMERQRVEAQERQKKEIAAVSSREKEEAERIMIEEQIKTQRAKIQSEEEVAILEQNKQRQIIVAVKNREKTDKVETERVEKDKQLEINEREKVVELAKIEKEKAVEEERKNIQDVIRERVVVEKAVVVEEEKIKDTRAFAEAERSKSVAIKNAEKDAEQALVAKIKDAESSKEAAKLKAEQDIIEAEAARKASENNASAKKILADAHATEIAAQGLAEAQVIEAKANAKKKEGQADAEVIIMKNEADSKGITIMAEAQSVANEKLGKVNIQLSVEKGLADAEVLEKTALAEAKSIELKAVAMEKQGLVEAHIYEKKSLAEAKGIDVKADALKKQGMSEADVMRQKALVDAERIKAEAEAMKVLDAVGRDMEVFKLNLAKDKEIELAKIKTAVDIAQAQAHALAEAFKASNINIVGGESMFYEKIIEAITRGKAIDSFVKNSEVVSEVKNLLVSAEGDSLQEKIGNMIRKFGFSASEIRDLSISALLLKMSSAASSDQDKGLIAQLMDAAKNAGIDAQLVSSILKK